MIFEIIDLLFPTLAVITFLILNERWKKKYDLSLKRHILIVTCRVLICVLVTLLLLFIFGFLLNASEIQLLPILAIGLGGTYAVTSYLFKPLYFK